MKPRTQTFSLTPRTWIGWIGTALVGLALLVTAALFVTVAMIAGLVIAAFLVARALWLLRKAEKARAGKFLQAEYRVEHEETTSIDSSTERDARRRP